MERQPPAVRKAVTLGKRHPRRKPMSWLSQSSVSLDCVINICLGSAKVHVNLEKMVATASITPYFTELKRFFQQNTKKNKINVSKSNAGTSRPTTGEQQPRKATILPSVTDVKELLQVTELKDTNCSGTSTTALVLCDTACSNSWVSDSLAGRLGLQGNALKLTVKGINTEELMDTKVVQLTVRPHKFQDFEAFNVRSNVRGTLNASSDIIDMALYRFL